MAARPPGVPLEAGQGAGDDTLVAWAELSGKRRIAEPRKGGLRFAFYGRVSTEDHQDPVTARTRQRDQAAALVSGRGRIVTEFFDVGQSRVLPWARRPQAAALLAAMADPDRGFDAIVVGEYERAFYGNQFSLMAPLFEHYGIQLRMPEVGGRIDFQAEGHEQMMIGLGIQSKREITRTRIRVSTAMATQVREQGRYQGGSPSLWVSAGGRGPTPEPCACRVGPAGSSAGAAPGYRADREVDLRSAAGRAQHGSDHPGAERHRSPLSVGRRSGA
jgi:site-specific DNA recombinase